MNDNPPPYGFTNQEFQGKGGRPYAAMEPQPPPYATAPIASPQPFVNVPTPIHTTGAGGMTTVVVSPTQTVIVGGCPGCRIGTLMEEFTCLGITCCILFFPLGLICLFCMQEKRCTNCQGKF